LSFFGTIFAVNYRKRGLPYNPKLGLGLQNKRGGEVKKLTTLIIICGILIAAPVYKANLISESATMVLLGVGLIVLSAIGRKKV
jgi:hypothetical protein